MKKQRIDGRINTAIRISPEMHEELKKAAEERDLSVNYIVNRALEDFLPRLIPVNEFKLTRE